MVSNSVAREQNVRELGMTPQALRVTDLEKFSFDQIWRPYWRSHSTNTNDQWGSDLKRAPFDLPETATQLTEPSKWSAQVIGRLTSVGVTFPGWVQHPLVDVIRELLGDPKAAGNVAMTDVEAVELIRSVLSSGSYQMPGEPLPYSTQAHAVWDAIKGRLRPPNVAGLAYGVKS
jgi:hypothetical protein